MTQETQKNPPSSRRHPKEVANSAVRQLNARIDRLGQSVLPKHPYLVSVPSDVPYRHSSRFVHTWFIGTPFERREEQLQYLSFLPHQGDHEELLAVLGGWSDDQGNYREEDSLLRTANNSGRNTPLDPSSRKKISLKDYKTKDKMATNAEQEMPQDATENKENVLSRSRSGLEHSEVGMKEVPEQSEVIRHQKEGTFKQHSPPSKPVPHLDGPFSDLPSPTSDHHDMSPRPYKRRRTSGSPPPRMGKTPEFDVAKAMPQLLSPTLPSPQQESSLPELLSPILPPTLLKAIETPPRQPTPENGHQHNRSDSVRAILANAINEGSPQPDSRNGPATGSLGSRIRSDSTHSARSTTSVGAPTNKQVAALKPSTPNLSPSRSPRPRQRHIIALKYGKKNRKRVEALLKFAARPKKVAHPQEPAEAPSSKDSKPPPLSIKMSREKSTDATLKVKPTHESLNHVKRPTTPVPSVREPKPSPHPSPNATRSIHATPKKELKSTAMRRVESVDGGDPATPGDKCRSSTPLSVERTSNPPKSSPGPTSVPHTSSEDRQAWSDLHQTYFQLGRTIKHDATDDTEPGSRRYAVLLVEALLSFMVSNTAQTITKPSAGIWITIIDYLKFVFSGTRKYPHLQGLVMQMGAVCRQQIQKHDLDRLARDPLPDEHMGSAPTPGSDGNTKSTEDSERYRREYTKFRDRMINNARELQSAWLDGSRHLSPELLQSEYHKTWVARRKDFRYRGTDRMTPSHIPKGYFLPVDAVTTPFEAIRFGLAFLAEWADIEGVKWATRIDV